MLLAHPGIELDKRAQNDSEHTALHVAAIHGKSDVVRTLLDKGVDVNAKTASWLKALCKGKKLAIMQDNDEHTALHVATMHGKSDVVRTLLDKGADVNAKTTAYYTPLHLAARYGKYDIVRMLLDKEADVNAKAAHHWRALHYAARFGSQDIVRTLLDKGADVNAIDYLGNDTALSEAIRKGHQEVATLLRNAGAHR